MMAQPTKGALHAMPSYASRRGGSRNLTPPSLAFVFLAFLSILFAGSASAQTGIVTGKVTDDAGIPQQFANVTILGAQSGGQTNAQGV